jgi:hypothetical protein
MHLFDELNEENFLLFASKNYKNPQCTNIQEFYDDVYRFKYIKKLLRRYEKNGDLQERLILNHMLILYNVFDIESANKMMFYKINSEHWPALKTFLIYLNFIKENEYVEIPLENQVVDALRKL